MIEIGKDGVTVKMTRGDYFETKTSSAASRSASPGAFYSGSYELMYAY